MIHTVYFWLKPELTAEDRADFVRGVKALATAPTVLAFYAGGPAGTESRDVTDHSFDYSIHLFFASEANQLAYQVDPIHLKFVDEQAQKFATVKVFDSRA
ncbi:MAG: hypothetical protein ACJAZ9_000266 [Neolewinella sp.]|jgi:hypothetical protein